jgi:hypothetical protein
LTQHTQALALHPDSSFASFSLLDEAARQHTFFFTAEEHWQAVNGQIAFRFLTYLHQQAGVRNLVLEGGYSYAHLLNRYLQSGNEQLLILALYDTPVCPVNQVQFFKQIYAFNQTLPPAQQIRLIGIDLEHSPLLVTECLYQLLPKKPLTAGVRDKIKELKAMHDAEGYVEKDARRYYRQLHKEVIERKRAYRRYWGEDFWRFEMILENLVMGFDSPVLRELVYAHGDEKKRELRLFENYLLLVKKEELAPGNCYAQFGGIHTELNPAINWGYPTLAQQLNESAASPVQGQVLTIGRYFRRYGQIYEKFKEAESFLSLMRFVEAKSQADLILIRLTAPELGFEELSKNMPFVLLLSESLEAERCR